MTVFLLVLVAALLADRVITHISARRRAVQDGLLAGLACNTAALDQNTRAVATAQFSQTTIVDLGLKAPPNQETPTSLDSDDDPPDAPTSSDPSKR